MKKPAVDYRNFKFSKLKTNEFNHLLYLLGWIGYFALYFITERFIKSENCYSVHCFLDDVIPFNEWFVIPYVFWYLLIVITLIFFALYDTDMFKGFMSFIIVTQVVAMAIYIIFPNKQDLRPQEFLNDNILTRTVSLLYTIDTNTNVCPSLHVAYSIGIASVWLKYKDISFWVKILTVAIVIIICLSTVFIKQHSVIDSLVAIPVCILAEFIGFGKRYWFKKKR